MDKRIERVRDWVAERGVPFEPALARLSDRLDGVLERRGRKQREDGDADEGDATQNE